MYLKKFLNSDKLYAFANLFYASANAISSLLIVKFFGLRLYGYLSYYNSIDLFIDYFGGYSRSTFEYASAETKDRIKIINSFAVLQIVLGIISLLFFLILSFFQQDSTAIKVCQAFIFLSPGKSYINFFRILSKVTGSLKWFTYTILFLSISNVLIAFLSNFYFDFFIYLILRCFLIIFSCFILFNFYSISINNLYDKLALTVKELKTKSKTLLIYSLISLSAIAIDKILIKHFFGVDILGVYSLAFLAYNMFFIFGGSLIGGNFKVLTNCLSNNYIKVLNNSILWVIWLMLAAEIFMLALIDYPIFSIYKESIPYIIWFLPASILSLFIQIAYIFLISKKYLYRFNKSFFYISFAYLISGISLSIYNDNCIWFAYLFMIYQTFIVLILAFKFSFLGNIFKKSFTHTKMLIFGLVIFQILFSYLI